ncbi:hypothetical protein [Kordia sp.]|uniref:hypothetical protein n=1 Tax=Kordia sp. TaxID=1965332 RepID=UPI003B5C67EF
MAFFTPILLLFVAVNIYKIDMNTNTNINVFICIIVIEFIVIMIVIIVYFSIKPFTTNKNIKKLNEVDKSIEDELGNNS